MDKRDLEQLLSDVADGVVTPAVALTRLQTAPTADLGFAQLDLSRGVRQGAGEVVYGAGKTAEQIAAIIEALRKGRTADSASAESSPCRVMPGRALASVTWNSRG